MQINKWYEAKTGGHQGLVIEENTGRNVAVTYDKADARLIAEAPKLLEDLFAASAYLKYHHGSDPRTANFCRMLDATIRNATDENPVQ